MQAIILAAGMGKRLKELTQNNTKCMIKVNGVTLIDRLLHQIEKCNISRIIIVIGYEGQKLIDYISTLELSTQVIFVNNPIYEKTNNIYSLALAKDYLCQEDTLLFESDLIFDDSIIGTLLNDPRETLALVDRYESWMDGTCVKLSSEDKIMAFIPGKDFDYNDKDSYYKTVNVYKFSKQFSNTYYVPFLTAYQKALGTNEYYEQVLRVIAMLDEPGIEAKRLNGQKWYEIDDIQDLDIAESMFASDEDMRVMLLQQRYGGYWRYPQLMDFCYLVNPYFPPQKLMNEIKASFERIVVQYPSGMRVNSLLAARNFGVHQENILVGNGAAELIKELMNRLPGRVGIIRPSFDEYAHRCNEKDLVVFWPQNDDYEYSAGDIISYFDNTDIETLILINPDNPTGNYIERTHLLELITWTKRKKINIVVDESFCDFADEKDNSLLDQNLLSNNPHLYVIKSISKSYGVPGFRLGVLTSGNVGAISAMKKDVAIWNINSFAEFYMQIAEKYKKDYATALKKFRDERIRYIDELKKINELRIIPSQANYIMAEIIGGISAAELTKALVVKHSILIKNLYGKVNNTNRQYIRLAIKNTKDNNALINALKEELVHPKAN